MNQTQQADNPVFQQLSSDKQEFLSELMEGAKQHSGPEMIPFFLEMQEKMQHQSMQFSKEETESLLDYISKQSLNPNEQLALQSLKMLCH